MLCVLFLVLLALVVVGWCVAYAMYYSFPFNTDD